MVVKKSSSIGKYRIIEELASSEIGRVYQAKDTSIAARNRIVNINVLHAKLLSSAQERQSFLQEAEHLKKLQHPSILPILDVGIAQDFPYLVTRYLPNGSLHDRLKRQAPRPLPIQEALIVLSQIGQALHYAHQHNVIHRDLKPANILFNEQGEALLANFGLGTLMAATMKYGIASDTALYMAPEQFRGTLSKEGDQYALACIAYELFTGRVPFTAPDFFALGIKHMSEIPLSPSQLNLLVPFAPGQAILKAMAKQRTDRYADIAAFLTALGVPATTPAYTPTTPQFSLPSFHSAAPPPTPLTPGTASSEYPNPKDSTGAIEARPNTSTDKVHPDLPNPNLGIHKRLPWNIQRKWLIAATIPLVLLLIFGSIFYALLTKWPALTASTATVTITPGSKAVSNISTIMAVISKPDPLLQQVYARHLSSPTVKGTETVPATGAETTTPAQARGTLTFFNDSTSPQPFPAGGIYTDSQGIQVTNDAGGTIPAGNPNKTHPTWSFVVVPAHANLSGQAGNIKTEDINQWTNNGLNSSMVVQNRVAFSGGRDAVYPFVQANDLNNATNPLERRLLRGAQTSLWAQVQSNESLIDPVQCTPHVSYDHPVGSKVASVTAIISVRCIGEVYDQHGAFSIAQNQLSATIAAGTDTVANKITATLMQTQVVDSRGTLRLVIQAISSAFSDSQRQKFAQLITGRNEQEAKSLLLKQAGISMVTIKVFGGDGQTLPTNPARIKVIVTS